MKRVLLSGIAALVAFCFAVSANEAAAAPVTKGVVKVAEKVVTLVVKGEKEEVVYTVTDTKDGEVAKLDGKNVAVTGKVDAEKKTIAAEKVEEVKEEAKK